MLRLLWVGDSDLVKGMAMWRKDAWELSWEERAKGILLGRNGIVQRPCG